MEFLIEKETTPQYNNKRSNKSERVIVSMNTIIQQVIENALSEFQKFYQSSNVFDICNNTAPLVKIANDIVLGLVKATAESIDRKIYEDKKTRKDQGLTVQQRNVNRTVALSIGTIEIERTSYYCKNKDAYVYPVDSIIGLESRERISKELAAELINNAVTSSYQHSCDEIDAVQISRQTVKNKLCELGEIVFEPGEQKKKVEHIDIYADEAHACGSQ